MPARYLVPVLVAGISLQVAVPIWLGLLTWALGLAEPRGQARQRATVASQWPPPVAPA